MHKSISSRRSAKLEETQRSNPMILKLERAKGFVAKPEPVPDDIIINELSSSKTQTEMYRTGTPKPTTPTIYPALRPNT